MVKMIKKVEVIEESDNWGNCVRIEKASNGVQTREISRRDGLYSIQIIFPDGRIFNERQVKNDVVSQEKFLPDGNILLRYNTAQFHECQTRFGELYTQLCVQFPDDKLGHWRSVGPRITNYFNYPRGIFPATILLKPNRGYKGMAIGQ